MKIFRAFAYNGPANDILLSQLGRDVGLLIHALWAPIRNCRLSQVKDEGSVLPEGFEFHRDGTAVASTGHMKERALSRLRAAMSYWLATTRPDGRPHSMPVWGVLVGNEFWFGTSGQKSRNLRHQPYAIVHHESADDVAIVEGTVERHAMEDLPQAVVDAFRKKYINPETGQPFELLDIQSMDEEAWMYVLHIKVGHAWLEGAFPETRTRWETGPGDEGRIQPGV